MNADEYAKLDALAIADLIRRQEIRSQEVVQCALEMIDRRDSEISAMVEIFRDRTQAQEQRSIAEAPFSGVPFLVKDLVCHEDGQIVEAGSRLAKGFVAAGATDLSKRFDRAGLVNLGRTKCPEFGFNMTTESVLHGPVNNPWKRGYSPGGSSGGSAAAVAAGYVPVAHANDGAGSIRIPASCCGIIGLKPTRGRVPVGPDTAEGLSGLGIEFVLTRTVRDAAAMLDAVCGHGIGDPYEIAAPLSPFIESLDSDPGPLRIGVWSQPPGGVLLDQPVAAELRRTMEQCCELGHHVEEIAFDVGVGWENYIVASANVWTAHLFRWISGLAAVTGRKIDHGTLELTSLAAFEHGRGLAADELLSSFDAFNLINRHFGNLFSRFDIVLSPTLPHLPSRHGVFDANATGIGAVEWVEKIFSGTPFTPVFNVTGLPAISIPLGWDEESGLPIGMQFGAGFGREDKLLQLARQFERTQRDGFRRLRCGGR